VVDYWLRPKPAYYILRRELAPLVAGLARVEGGAALWAVNGAAAPVAGELALSAWTLGGERVAEERRPARLPANAAIELGNWPCQGEEPLVFAARLLVDGAVVARSALWPEPFKYLDPPDPGVEVSRDGERLRLRCARPAKGVWLSAGDGVQWSDNMLDLLPGDEQTVLAAGLGDAPLRVEWLRWSNER
jgi:beta-mannosidase